MSEIRSHRSKFPQRLYFFLVAFSVLGHGLADLTHLNPGLIAPIAGAATLLSGLALLFSSLEKPNQMLWAFVFALFVGGAAIELIGIATGWPFGSYEYTEIWKPVIFIAGIGRFPLLLPFAWVLIVTASAFSVAEVSSIPARCLLAGLLAVAVDLTMEGVLAGRLGYWKWTTPGPLPGSSPWTNSISWFVLSFIGAAMLNTKVARSGDVPRPCDARTVLIGQVLLMLGLALA